MIDFIYSRNLAEMFSALFVWMKFAGFNNKIKVAKRIGYGYRDDDFLFYLDSLSFYSFCPFTIPQKIVMNLFYCVYHKEITALYCEYKAVTKNNLS